MRRLERRKQGERGAVGPFVVVVVTAVAPVLIGLVYDGGSNMVDKRNAARTAEQAARVAADQMSSDALHQGTTEVDTADAVAAGESYLAQADATGTVSVDGDGAVTVTVVDDTDTVFLSGFGWESIPVEESATAESITNDTRPGDV